MENQGMKQAKPRPGEFEALVEFHNEMESLLGYTGRDRDRRPKNEAELLEMIRDAWIEMSAGCSWERVLWAGQTAIENACDPNARTLEFKDEIKAALEAMKIRTGSITSIPEGFQIIDDPQNAG